MSPSITGREVVGQHRTALGEPHKSAFLVRIVRQARMPDDLSMVQGTYVTRVEVVFELGYESERVESLTQQQLSSLHRLLGEALAATSKQDWSA